MNINDLNPNVEEAFEGRELKLCSNPAECCKELSRVWLALGDGAIKRPYLGSASERVKKLRMDNARIRAAVHVIVKGFDDGVFVRSTERDQNPKWAIELLPYIQALQALHEEGQPR